MANPLATDTLWDAAGDLVQGSGANTAAKLTKGAEGTILRAGAASNAYSTATFADTYAKGTFLYNASANTVASLAHPGAANYFLMTNAADTAAWTLGTNLNSLNGLTFADVSVVQLTGAGASAVLTSGGNNYFLKSNSDNSALEFATPAAALTAIGGAPAVGSTSLVNYGPTALQEASCTANALTLTPTAGLGIVNISVTQTGDANCAITMGETSEVEGTIAIIKNVSDGAAETLTFTSSANVLRLMQGSPYVMAINETLILQRKNGEWLEIGRSSATLGIATLNMSGSTSSIPWITGTDPDLTLDYAAGLDTDGANISGDMSLRVRDTDDNQVMMGRKLHDIHVTVVKPQDMADAVRDAFLIWSNETGMTFTITQIKAWAGADDTSVNVEETDADGANNATVDALEIATGSGPYTVTETTITGATIEAGHLLWLDFDDTDDPSYVKVTITGWFNANVD